MLTLLVSCRSRHNAAPEESVVNTRDTSAGQKEITLLQDEHKPTMPLIGKAQNQKGGAVLVHESGTYWIEGLNSWSNEYQDQPVRVWGEIVLRSDNPVFLDTSEVVSQGIPVETQAQLETNQNRYWIINATYERVRP